MALNLRTLGLGVAILGVAVGVAFGSGIAYGRGDPKTVEGGLTQQQIQSLLGIGATGGAGATGGTRGTGTQGTTGTASGTTGAASRSASGRIVSVAGNVITIETAQGQSKVNIGPTTTLSRSSTAAVTDLREGMTIVAAGTRNADGSFDASSLSQVPAELQAILGGGGGPTGAAGAGGGANPGASGAATPTATPAR